MPALMDLSRSRDDLAIRTPFSDTHDLIQILRGIAPAAPDANHPVDFRLAALQRKGHPDIWHMDQVLAFSTDECSPMVINGEDIGGNHGHTCGVIVTAPEHGRDVHDVGSLWADDAGMRWTLLRVEDADRLLFLSDNTGPSVTAYDFCDHVEGTLRCVENAAHPGPICPTGQTGHEQLVPAIRHLQKEVWVCRNGAWQRMADGASGCEAAEIREVYEIMNPACVAQAIRSARPDGGYSQQPSLAAGEAMMIHRMTYRITPDGTILCDFDHQLLQDVHMPLYLGIMHQEKCDVYGGGVWRCIPKLLPFEDKGRICDFSRPYLTTAETMPHGRRLTPDLWTEPLSPPDRQLDLIRRPDGSAIGFAAGFLPLYDGAPAHRAQHITEAATLVRSCKTYPVFAGGGTQSFPHLRGVAYKKYFPVAAADAALYTIPCGADTYLFMDFFGDEPRALTHPCENSRIRVLEATADHHLQGGLLTGRASNGYAVFHLTP